MFVSGVGGWGGRLGLNKPGVLIEQPTLYSCYYIVLPNRMNTWQCLQFCHHMNMYS